VLFVDPVSYAVLVLDPAARITGVRSIWRVQDTYLFTNPGQLLRLAERPTRKGESCYRVPAQPAPPTGRAAAGRSYFPPDPDSAFVAGIDLDTRQARHARRDPHSEEHLPDQADCRRLFLDHEHG
jgi:hypothetical protein